MLKIKHNYTGYGRPNQTHCIVKYSIQQITKQYVYRMKLRVELKYDIVDIQGHI